MAAANPPKDLTALVQWVLIVILGTVLGLVIVGGYFTMLEARDTRLYLERLVLENRQRWSVVDQRVSILEFCEGIVSTPIP